MSLRESNKSSASLTRKWGNIHMPKVIVPQWVLDTHCKIIHIHMYNLHFTYFWKEKDKKTYINLLQVHNYGLFCVVYPNKKTFTLAEVIWQEIFKQYENILGTVLQNEACILKLHMIFTTSYFFEFLCFWIPNPYQNLLILVWSSLSFSKSLSTFAWKYSMLKKKEIYFSLCSLRVEWSLPIKSIFSADR